MNTFQNVEFENPGHELRPGIILAPAHFPGVVLFTAATFRRGIVFRSDRNFGSTPFCCGREHPIEVNKIFARSWNRVPEVLSETF